MNRWLMMVDDGVWNSDVENLKKKQNKTEFKTSNSNDSSRGWLVYMIWGFLNDNRL